MAPGQQRPVRMIVDPDVCGSITATFTSDNASVAAAPPNGSLDLRHATYDFYVEGGVVGTATLTATVPNENKDGGEAKEELKVDVRNPDLPKCSAADDTTVGMSETAPIAKGKGSLANAEITLGAAAFRHTSDPFGFAPFTAEIACREGNLAVPGRALVPIGPAVRFGAQGGNIDVNRSLRREIDFAVPVNPAIVPRLARIRHLEMIFTSAKAKTPRVVHVTNARFERAGPDWVLRFKAPYFGTYQAAFDPNAGTSTRTRRVTHRAIVGVSMGGGGAATVGVRHHDKFDAIAALGGAFSDWTFFLWYVENYMLGGFCPVGQTCKPYQPWEYPFDEPYAHTQDFNHWWYEKGSGNGGGFPRSTYLQALHDFAMMQGNPNGQNDDPQLSWFTGGAKSSDPWVKGDIGSLGLPAGIDCRAWVDPVKNDPLSSLEGMWRDQCIASRCDPKNALVFPTGYYDDEYNPDGSRQVISFCDNGISGTARDMASPYGNTWAPGGAFPVSLALAVDLNKNGVRDMDEPVIRQGHEPWTDTGTDGIADPQEPGYDPISNPDPNEDDYDAFLNPNGTENDHYYEPGEPFLDVGIDGVPNTATKNVVGDIGEGDGQYTMTKGLEAFYKIDPDAMLRRRVPAPGGPLDDDAFRRLDILVDGGVRDFMNMGAVSRHLMAAIQSRRNADGSYLKTIGTIHGFDMLPGQMPGKPDNFSPALIRWSDMPASSMLWYGDVDATPQMILDGDGMHVGTGLQILSRIELAFYYVSRRWTDADRLLTETPVDDPHHPDLAPETTTKNELGTTCEIMGRCEKMFRGPKTGRVGPIAIGLPPGYALEANRKRDVRYPVVYVLHGYGQDPRDLEALAIITNNYMNDGQHSYYSRLPKFIEVYVDGRCRLPEDAKNPADKTLIGAPECYQGTFYMNSTRNDAKAGPYGMGPQIEDWMLEVMDYVDQNYRTMPPSDIQVTD